MSDVSINKFKGVSALDFSRLPKKLQKMYYPLRAIANRVENRVVKGNNSKRSRRHLPKTRQKSPLSVNITAKMKGGRGRGKIEKRTRKRKGRV